MASSSQTPNSIIYRLYNDSTDRNSAKSIVRTYIGEGYEEDLPRRAATTIVAVSGSQVVGVLIYKQYTVDTISEICALAVLPAYRKQGVAGGLETHFERQNQGRLLMAGGVPKEAASFYRRQGYKMTGPSRAEKQARGRSLQQIPGQQRSASSASRSRRRNAVPSLAQS